LQRKERNPLDKKTLNLFASKGMEGKDSEGHGCNGNAVKVRRVIQIVSDLLNKPLDTARVLDLACGEGVYAIETALRGAEVIAQDARTERMGEGAEAAKRLGLNSLTFEQGDVRNISVVSHGSFDVIYLLGMLYHLDEPDSFYVVRNLYEMCRGFIVIDTHISHAPQKTVKFEGREYEGEKVREHGGSDPTSVRRSRLLASIDNPQSFYYTKDSLIRLLYDIGFSSVFECHVPFEPLKSTDRITLVAVKGKCVRISAYPWINKKSEDEILSLLQPKRGPKGFSFRERARWLLKAVINIIFRPLGFEIRRRVD